LNSLGRQIDYLPISVTDRWCSARHTVPCDTLPDWFLGFDVYETSTGRFWSVDRRNAWLAEAGVCAIPEVARGRFHLKILLNLLGRSAVGPRKDRQQRVQTTDRGALNPATVVPIQLAMTHV
jgi:hypothetical protein